MKRVSRKSALSTRTRLWSRSTFQQRIKISPTASELFPSPNSTSPSEKDRLVFYNCRVLRPGVRTSFQTCKFCTAGIDCFSGENIFHESQSTLTYNFNLHLLTLCHSVQQSITASGKSRIISVRPNGFQV